MARTAVARVLLTYIAVSSFILVSANFFGTEDEHLTSIPVLLSIFLVLLIYIWFRVLCDKDGLSTKIDEKEKRIVVFWSFMLFLLALSVRVPSVLLFGIPYEKTPLIYLIVLTVVIIEEIDVSVFGFKIRNMGKSLISGLVFFLVLGGLNLLMYYLLIYVFTGIIPIQSYDVMRFLWPMPFMTFCVGISEEGFFRGYIQTHFEKFYSSKQAIFIQSILFGVWHFVWDIHPFAPIYMTFYVGSTFLIGLVFGYFYSKTRNLVPLVFAHGLFNSVPQGVVENRLVLEALEIIPLLNQILVWTFPYTIAVISAVLFVKYLVRQK